MNPMRPLRSVAQPDNTDPTARSAPAGRAIERFMSRSTPATGSTPLIMGVLNVTPDSFSDGGRWFEPVVALRHARQMAEAGADIIDVGGESTRPGALEVSVEEELKRTIPIVSAIATELDVRVSIDTSKPEVIRAAVDAGASLINDVRALREPGALEAAAESGADICLMHMQGDPRTMQASPSYDDVVADVSNFLRSRVTACLDAGVAPARLWLDPGFGFGKTLEHNLALLRRLPELAALGYPLLVGLSRKSLLQAITGRAVDDRLAGSLALALLAAQGGAGMLRVHDVAETRDVLTVWRAAFPTQAHAE